MGFKEWFTQEYDRDLEKRIKSATRISMSHDDKAKTCDFLVSYMRMHPARVPLASHKHWFSWSLHPYPIIAGLLIVALGGGTAGAASLAENALPGDLLYPIKVNVNEEVRAALATTPEKKAVVAIERAERRIDELTSLETRGEVASDIRADIDARIDRHVHDAEVETNRVDDSEKERRLVAMLRVHENLIAESELGGAVEPDVSLASVMAYDASAGDASVEPEVAMMASMPTGEVTTMAITAPAPESIENTARAVAAPALEEDIAPRVAKNLAAKKTMTESSTSTKSIARQKKAAEQRIEALEKLLKGKRSRVDSAALEHAQSELAAAQTALEEGRAFFEDQSWADATVRFNAAIRIAIDAREFLANAPKVEDEKKSDGRRESRSGRERDGDDD